MKLKSQLKVRVAPVIKLERKSIPASLPPPSRSRLANARAGINDL
jgi:hypothetical protein